MELGVCLFSQYLYLLYDSSFLSRGNFVFTTEGHPLPGQWVALLPCPLNPELITLIRCSASCGWQQNTLLYVGLNHGRCITTGRAVPVEAFFSSTTSLRCSISGATLYLWCVCLPSGMQPGVVG